MGQSYAVITRSGGDLTSIDPFRTLSVVPRNVDDFVAPRNRLSSLVLGSQVLLFLLKLSGYQVERDESFSAVIRRLINVIKSKIDSKPLLLLTTMNPQPFNCLQFRRVLKRVALLKSLLAKQVA